MQRILDLRVGWALVLFAFLDLACVVLGMGVPIFCILLGVPVGWFVVETAAARGLTDAETRSEVLLGGVVTAVFTAVAMALVWGPSAALLVDGRTDLAGLGVPLLLNHPLASFVGWLALMILVSPALQLLMTLFGAHLTLLARGGVSGELLDHGV
jgi:hypothetical protein